MILGDVFKLIQGHQITDEELYIAEGNIPVFTGQNELKGFWQNTLVDKNDLPCITYPTKGNQEGRAYVQYDLFDANNTAVLIPKPNWREKIILKWFVHQLRHILVDIQTSKGGVSYLNKEIVECYEIEVPKKIIQTKQIRVIKRLTGFKEELERMVGEIDVSLGKKIIE